MDIIGDSKACIVERFSVTCGRLVSHLQLACCSSHYALPWQGNNLMIHSIADSDDKQPLQLTGHHGDVSAVVFGTGGAPLLLCSASEDYVIVWDIGRCYRRAQEGVIASGTIVGTLLGNVLHLSLCPLDERVAACSGSKVYVLDAKKERVLAVLRGHAGPLTASEFFPWDRDVLVSVSEDRTFKIWHVEKEEVLYQSAVLSGCPLLSVAIMEQNRRLVTGSADGQVWCYTLPDDYKCCLVTRLDLHKAAQKHQRHLEGRGLQTDGASGILHAEQRGAVETTKPVLRICGNSRPPDPGHRQERERSSLWMGSSDGLYLVDLDTSELRTALYFRDYSNLSISMVGSWAISQGKNKNMYCLVTSLFEPRVALLEVAVPALDDLCALLAKAFPGQESLSVVPSSPPTPKSPLNAELTKRDPKPPKKTGFNSQGGVRDQALVFHTQVKSSGYTVPPRRTMFTPKTNIQKKTQGPSKTSKKRGCILSEYPLHAAAPSVPQSQLSVSTTPTPICCLQYSGDGKQILCGLGDRSVLLYKSSLAGTPAVYTGHNKAVSSVCWSHSRLWFLTASEDQSLCIWPSGGPEPALTLGGERFSKPIRSAQFYYLDKFLLLASGSSVHLFLHHLDAARDDIKRYERKSMAKLTGSFCTESGTDITAVSAINDFFSYIVLASGADRSIQLLDLNVGCVSAEIPDAHSRAVHHITQNKGSMFSTQSQDSYNLFLSSALTDGVKLWDVRSIRCVRRYENHRSRCHQCTAAISPCGRYIAAGSEDNCAYVYDIRSSSYLHKLQRHSDTVLNVAFNPANPEVRTLFFSSFLI